MGNCYIFNTANTVLQVTLNNVSLGYVAPAAPSGGYAPQSTVTPTARHDDGEGFLAIGDPNQLTLFYPDDPQQMFGPYNTALCFGGRPVSVDDDIVIFAGRTSPAAAPVVTMTTRGFVLNTACGPSATLSQAVEEGPA